MLRKFTQATEVSRLLNGFDVLEIIMKMSDTDEVERIKTESTVMLNLSVSFCQRLNVSIAASSQSAENDDCMHIYSCGYCALQW